MRRFFFLLLILLTYYLAGMYRSLPLLILCAAEFLTVIFSFLLTRYFRRKIAASFQKKTDTARAGETAVCSLVVTSASRLPVGRCVLTVEAGFPRRRESGKGKRRLESRAEFGENPSFFRISVPHCGIVRIRLTRIRVYDYFLLFSAKKKTDEEMLLAVFPKEQALQIRSSLSEWTDPGFLQDRTENMQGDARHEIRQVREYRSGDSLRSVHRNLSARSGNLWIKEYERETEGVARVFLDLSEFCAAGPSERDCFYRLLWALVTGLLLSVSSAEVSWYDSVEAGTDTEEEKNTIIRRASVRDEEECRGMFYRLYQTEERLESAAALSAPRQPEGRTERDTFVLDTKLVLYRNGKPVFRFSGENLEKEIGEQILIV